MVARAEIYLNDLDKVHNHVPPLRLLYLHDRTERAVQRLTKRKLHPLVLEIERVKKLHRRLVRQQPWKTRQSAMLDKLPWTVVV